MESIDVLQTPDESRPVKRVRLDASLGITKDTQEEMMDDDDWDDVYGDDEHHERPAKEPRTADALASTDDQQPQSYPTGNASNLAAPPAMTSASPAHALPPQTSTDIAGVPAEAIAKDDDLVAPRPALDGMDVESTKVVEETADIEVQAPIQDAPAHGPSHTASEQEPTAMQVDANGNNEQGNAQESGHPSSENVGASQRNPKPPVDPDFLVAATAQKGNVAAEWQFDASDAASSSDSSSSDSDDSSDDDSDSEGGYEMLDAATAAKILMSGDGDDDDGDRGKGKSNYQPRTTNEVADTLVPKPDVVITPEMKLTLLGTIERTVETMALIKGVTPGEYQVLEAGSVLCNESREVIGAVAETFGRVQEPMYSVAFSNKEEIEEAGLQFGTKIYYVDSHSTFVFTQPLKNLKGTDASNIHDEEVGEDEIEFSDDEKEAEYKRQKKLSKKAGRGGLSRSAFNEADSARHLGSSGRETGPAFAPGGSDAPSQSYGGGMRYDDDEETAEEFYQPLKRPENLSQLMAGGLPPPRQPVPSFDRGRGRGRGDRGRGERGRGRGDRGRGRGGSDAHGHRGGRGGVAGQQGSPNIHRGNAQSFPDRHNNRAIGWQQQQQQQQHSLPPKPDVPRAPQPASSAPAPNHPNSSYSQYAPQPQTYQFNGYTFQYGSQPQTTPQQAYPTPQPPFPAHPQPPHGTSIPAGAYVNPAFLQQQAQQQAQQQGYSHWGSSQSQPPLQQHQYQPPHPGAAVPSGGQHPQQQVNLAEILRRLGGPQTQ